MLNKTCVFVSIVLIIVIIGQSFFYIQTLNNYTNLQSNYSQLTSSYGTLDTLYSSLQDQYSSLEEVYSSSQTQISSFISQINYLTEQVDIQHDFGYDTGYTQGVIDGVGKGYTLRDPTYAEVLNFRAENTVDQNPYNKDTYVCVNFAGDFKNDAFRAGYRCGYVTIDFVDSGHVIMYFDCIDVGVVYIEPQNDEIVTLVVGQHYWDRTIYSPPSYDDTVIQFFTIW